MPYVNSIGQPAGYEDEMGQLQYEDMPYGDTMNPVADALESPATSPMMPPGGFFGAPGGMPIPPAMPPGPPSMMPQGPSPMMPQGPSPMMPPGMDMSQMQMPVQPLDENSMQQVMRGMLMERAAKREAAAKRVTQKFSKVGPGTPGGY